MPTSSTGYSGTPLAKKLGFKSGMCVVLRDAPKNYSELIDPAPPGVLFAAQIDADTDLVHSFVTQTKDLQRQLRDLRTKLKADAVLWVSWPKRASKQATDITEDRIRELALPLGWVDVKVCAVDQVWSALKLVVRKELR
jgi:hypothetical protein